MKSLTPGDAEADHPTTVLSETHQPLYPERAVLHNRQIYTRWERNALMTQKFLTVNTQHAKTVLSLKKKKNKKKRKQRRMLRKTYKFIAS